MAGMYPPFAPGVLTVQTAGASNARLAFPTTDVGDQVFVFNASATIPVVVAFGGVTVVAAAPDSTWAPSGAVGPQAFIPPGQGRILTRGGAAYIAFIRVGGSDATIYIGTGLGS